MRAGHYPAKYLNVSQDKNRRKCGDPNEITPQVF
jgi:hypothetical protein